MLLNSLIFLLLSNSITSRRDKSILYSRIAITILLISAFIAYDNLYILFLAKGIGIFGGLFHTTATTNSFHIFIFFITSFILCLTSFYPRKVWLKDYSSPNRILFTKLIYYGTFITNKMGEQFKIIEYSLIILFIVTGSVFLISTSDLVSIFLSIELQSYGLYLLSTIYRDSEPATYGGLMYFLLGGLSSCFILLSTALLYANSGTTNLDSLYIITSISNDSKENLTGLLYWYKADYIQISLLFMGVGFLFKVSAAPFHFWSPDVYDAIPTVVTTFVAIIAKISIFIFLLELVHYTGKSGFDMDFSWTTSLLFSSLLSLFIGTVVGLTQSRINILFAFSSISHVGFMNNMQMSAFFTGKGKGKMPISDDESLESKHHSDVDSEDDEQLQRAKALSLKANRVNKQGQSSKDPGNYSEKDPGNYSEKDYFKEDIDSLAYKTKTWKYLKDTFKDTARRHNDLLEKNIKTPDDLVAITQGKEKADLLKNEISSLEKYLLEYGIDPSVQYKGESDTTSDDNSSDYSSDKSEARPNKRQKNLSSDDNKNLGLVLPFFAGLLPYKFIIRGLSVIASAVFLLLAHLDIMTALDFFSIYVPILDLISLYLTVRFLKLMYKMYNTVIMIYNSYLNKDYMVLYANILFSTIIILLCICSNDVYVLSL